MKRYESLTKQEIYNALNKLRDALLAAQDGNDVNFIIDGLFTEEEKLQLGRRILIAEMLIRGDIHEDIAFDLHVGKATINSVYKKLIMHPECFNLILKRGQRVEKEYKTGKYKLEGGSQIVFKKNVYTGLKRKDIKR